MALNDLENIISRKAAQHQAVTNLVQATSAISQMLQGKPDAEKLVANLEKAVSAACEAAMAEVRRDAVRP